MTKVVYQNMKKLIDQPIANSTGTLTQNGLFYQAAENYKEGERKQPAKIKVYRKIKMGIWVDMGFYNLIDASIEYDGNRNVFKFFLNPIFEEIQPDKIENVDLLHNRSIPGDVMQEVYLRDRGKCVQCGTEDNIHFDHKIPYSKGGSSKTAKNIQLLCAKHNLSKSNKLIY